MWNTHALQYFQQPIPYPLHHPDAAQVAPNIPVAEFHLSLSESHLREKTQRLFSCITHTLLHTTEMLQDSSHGTVQFPDHKLF